MELCRKLLYSWMYLIPVVVAYYYFRSDKFDPQSIRGKNVLVTGASSGIGEKIAYRYAELGAKLVITARRKELLDKVALKCKELGANVVHTVSADMALPADRKRLVVELEKKLGGLDFLVLNHAVMDYFWWNGTTEDMSKLEFMTNVNFLSFVDITSRVLKLLEKSQGYISVVSSIAGKLGWPGAAHYCSNKHALQGFYSSLRQELKVRKTGVSVTLVVYGPINSEKAFEIMNDVPTAIEFETMAGTTEEAADVLLKGTSARRYELFYPYSSDVMVFLHGLFPKCIEDFISILMLMNE